MSGGGLLRRAALGLCAGLMVVFAVCPTAALASGSVSYLSQFGSNGSDSGQLSFPAGVAVDSAGNIYVADTSNDRIDKFGSSGSFVEAWGWGVAGGAGFETCTSSCQAGTSGGGAGQLNGPEAIAIDSSDNLYVADTGNARVDEFTSSGNFTEAWGWGVSTGVSQLETCTANCQAGIAGAGAGQIDQPFGIAVDASNVYVSDRNENRVDKFSLTGSFTEAWGWGVSDGSSAFQTCTASCQAGIAGGAAGQFYLPLGIAIGSGHVYVADGGNDRIDESSPAGSFVRAWGWGVSDGGQAFQTCTTNCQAGNSGGGAGEMNAPFGVATDAAGNVYVADNVNERTDEFSSSGGFVVSWGWGVSDDSSQFETCTSGCVNGQTGSGAGQFDTPQGVAIHGSDIYVADSGNGRIEQFSNPPANHTLTVSKSGSGSGTVTSSPAGIACGARCSAQFGAGTTVTLTASPASGSTFAGWSGGGCSATKATCTVKLSSDQRVTAAFSVVLRTSTTSLTSSPNPAAVGQQVTYTATVSPAPTAGTVQFTDGGAPITGCAAVPVNPTQGTSTCQTSYAATGYHSIQAVYSGAAALAGSQSGVLTELVGGCTTQAAQGTGSTGGGVASVEVALGGGSFEPVSINGLAQFNLSNVTVGPNNVLTKRVGPTTWTNITIKVLPCSQADVAFSQFAAADRPQGVAPENLTIEINDAAGNPVESLSLSHADVVSEGICQLNAGQQNQVCLHNYTVAFQSVSLGSASWPGQTSSTATVSNGSATVTMRCASAHGCVGVLTLTAVVARLAAAKGRHTIVLGKTRFRVRPHHKAKLSIHLSRAARRLLKRSHTLRAQLSIDPKGVARSLSARRPIKLVKR